MNIYNIYNVYCFLFCLCVNPICIVGAAAKPLLWRAATRAYFRGTGQPERLRTAMSSIEFIAT